MRVKRVVRGDTGAPYGWRFDCPGCGTPHVVTDGWTFNGSEDRPTFSPSILVTYDGRDADGKEVHVGTLTTKGPPSRCHSFVTDGRIAFCADSSHALAGQTVDLPEVA